MTTDPLAVRPHALRAALADRHSSFHYCHGDLGRVAYSGETYPCDTARALALPPDHEECDRMRAEARARMEELEARLAAIQPAIDPTEAWWAEWFATHSPEEHAVVVGVVNRLAALAATPPAIDPERLARALHQTHYDLPMPERLGGGRPEFGGPDCDCIHDAAAIIAAYEADPAPVHGPVSRDERERDTAEPG